MTDLIGKVIRDYEVQEKVGEGGFGSVYRAYHSSVNREVAIKVILPERASQKDFIKRFDAEAKLVAKLEHPHIVPLYDYWRDEEGAFLVMRWLSDGNVRELLDRGPMKLERLKLLLEQIGSALTLAHEQQVVHRDIKPENILLDNSGNFYLTDFGIAKDLRGEIQANTTMGILGTPAYLSPEQSTEKKITSKSDIYNVGVLLFECLTGQHPFEGVDPIQQILKHISEPIPSIMEINPDFPKELDLVIQKATAKEAKDRFKSIQELVEGYKRAMGDSKDNLPPIKNSLRSKAPISSTPFTFGNPIKTPERFIGRKAEIRRITSRLLSSAHESTSIVGERRIGKTSLLYYLSNPEVATELGLTEDKYCIAYIDFQGLLEITPTKFWNRVLRQIQKKIKIESSLKQIEQLRSQDSIDLFDLEDLFETISDAGLHVVLMLDEFEYVTQNTNFQVDFFSGLRALAIHSNLSLITSTRKQLVDLAHSEEIKGSPFFNIFAVVVLRSFAPEEIEEFIARYTKLGEQNLSKKEIDFIERYGGGSPIFLQIAGHSILESKYENTNSKKQLYDAAEKFGEQAGQHFSYYWSQTSENEKLTLLSVLAFSSSAKKKGQKSKLKNLIKINSQALIDTKSLHGRGLIVKHEENFSIFSPGLETWIKLELSSSQEDESSEISAEEWLKTIGQADSPGSERVLSKFKSKYWPLIGKLSKEISFELMEKAFLNEISD